MGKYWPTSHSIADDRAAARRDDYEGGWDHVLAPYETAARAEA